MAIKHWPKGTWMQIRPEAPDFIRAAMKRDDLSYRQIGDALHISHTMLHQLVTGHRKTCTPELAATYERYLGFLPGSLFVEKASITDGQTVPRRRNRRAA